MQLNATNLSMSIAGSLLTTTAASAQTWATDVSSALAPRDVVLAVSDEGRAAVLGTTEEPGVFHRASITIHDAFGTERADYDLVAFSGGHAEILTLDFADDQTLVLGGSIANEPFLGAIDADTGVRRWDVSFAVDGRVTHVAERAGGGFLAAGTYAGAQHDRLFLFAVDAAGNIQWDLAYGAASFPVRPLGLDTDGSGRAILLLDVDDRKQIVRLAPDGQVELTRVLIPLPGIFGNSAVAAHENGDVVVAWSVSLASGIGTDVHRLDADFQPIHSRRFELPGLFTSWSGLKGLSIKEDGGVLVGAELRNAGTGAPTDAVVVSLDDGGTLEWARRLTNSGNSLSPDVAATPGGGFFAATETLDSGVRLVRGNSAGVIGDCAGAPVSALVTTSAFDQQFAFFSPSDFTGLQSNRFLSPNPVTRTHLTACAEGCQIVGNDYGAGTPGSTGIPPRLITQSGMCLSYGPALHVTDGLGGAPTLIGIGPIPASLPLLGGTVLIHPSTTTYLPALVLDGPSGVVGVGTGTIQFGGDLSALENSTLYSQAFVLDPTAPAGVAMSNGAFFVGL